MQYKSCKKHSGKLLCAFIMTLFFPNYCLRRKCYCLHYIRIIKYRLGHFSAIKLIQTMKLDRAGNFFYISMIYCLGLIVYALILILILGNIFEEERNIQYNNIQEKQQRCTLEQPMIHISYNLAIKIKSSNIK